MPLYRAAGLIVHSDAALPGLPVHAADDTPHLTLRHGPLPPGLDHDARPWEHARDRALRIDVARGGDYLLRYDDGTRFRVDAAGSRVDAETPPGATLDDTATYLLGPVLAFVLRLRGTVSLHASAVALHGHAVLMAGPPGAGKSTTAAALALAGVPLLSDDVMPLSETHAGVLAGPGLPRVRVWPESAEALFGSREALPRLTPNWDKRYLDPEAAGLATVEAALPVGVVYVFGAREDAPAAPRIEPLAERDALFALLAHSYGASRMDPEMRARNFRVIARLLEQAPVLRLIPHADPARLADLCARVTDDAAARLAD